MNTMIKIVIIDDHVLFMEGISALLSHCEGIQVVAKMSDSRVAIDALKQTEHDIILMDYQMPVLNGLELLEEIASSNIGSKVIMLSTFDSHDLVKSFMQSGALGYLRKDIDYPTLIQAIQRVHAKEPFIQPFFASPIELEVSRHLPTGVQKIELTTGEQQVLKLIAAGFSNVEISEMLFKSSGRIRNIVSSLLTKMDVRDRTQAAMKGLQSGLL